MKWVHCWKTKRTATHIHLGGRVEEKADVVEYCTYFTAPAFFVLVPILRERTGVAIANCKSTSAILLAGRLRAGSAETFTER
jgi:hypothetical protein